MPAKILANEGGCEIAIVDIPELSGMYVSIKMGTEHKHGFYRLTEYTGNRWDDAKRKFKRNYINIIADIKLRGGMSEHMAHVLVHQILEII